MGLLNKLRLVGSGRADRTALLAAIAARDAAQREVPAARETLDGMQAVVDRADYAARAAADAQRAAIEAQKRWISGGCKYSEALEHHRLAEVAAEATRAAARAAADVSAVSGELGRAEEAIQEAQSKVRGCEGTISRAIAEVIAEEQKRKVARLEAILAELPGAWLDVQAVEELVSPWWPHNDGLRGSDESHALFARMLQQGGEVLRSLGRNIDRYSSHPLYEGLDQRKRLLLERAKQLRADPES